MVAPDLITLDRILDATFHLPAPDGVTDPCPVVDRRTAGAVVDQALRHVIPTVCNPWYTLLVWCGVCGEQHISLLTWGDAPDAAWACPHCGNGGWLQNRGSARKLIARFLAAEARD